MCTESPNTSEPAWDCEDKVLDEVDVMEWVNPAEVGELGSIGPDESFVRFFFKKPKVGMRPPCSNDI